jgi:hypothetical protein
LPYEAENQSLGTINDIGALDTNHVHFVRLGELDGVIGVFDGLEPRKLLPFLWFGDSAPDN